MGLGGSSGHLWSNHLPEAELLPTVGEVSHGFVCMSQKTHQQWRYHTVMGWPAQCCTTLQVKKLSFSILSSRKVILLRLFYLNAFCLYSLICLCPDVWCIRLTSLPLPLHSHRQENNCKCSRKDYAFSWAPQTPTLIPTGISLLHQDFGWDDSLTYATQPHLWFTGYLHQLIYLWTVQYVTDEKTIKSLQMASWKDCSLHG